MPNSAHPNVWPNLFYRSPDVPPIGLSFWRTAVGFLLLLPFVIGPIRREFGILRAAWPVLALIAFLLIVGGNAVLFLSLQFTYAVNAGVINSVEPVIILVLAWALFGDPVSKRQAFGVAVSLSGVVVLVVQGDLANLAALDFNLGDLLAFAAYVSWGFYAVMLRKLPRGLDPRVVLAAILGLGSLELLPFYVIETVVYRPIVPSWTTAWTVGLLAVISSIAAVLMWNRAIAHLGPGRAGILIHLIPAFTVLLAIALLGEALRQYHVTGIALIAIGIYFSTISRGRREGA